MSTGQQPNQLNQMVQTINQYKQNMEFLNNNIMSLRQNIERTDIPNEEKEALRKQEQDLQSKLVMFQTLVNNLTSQLYTQQRVLSQQNSPASVADNVSTPGSPASFNPQQQQQQQPNFASVQAATMNVQQQQQAQQQQQQQQQQQLRNAQQQQQLQSKMTFASPSTPQQQASASPIAIKNNGMFVPPSNDLNTPSVEGQMQMPTLRPAPVSSVDADGVSRVLTKRKIQELVTQIDPSERLEPEVEDILLEIADEFIESVTSFACKIAKHRKSDVLEVKDVQLHLERNWNIRIPGFAADDIRAVKKPNIPSSHQAKIQAIQTAKSQAPSKK